MRRFPSSVGISPTKRFLARTRFSMEMRLPSDEGTLPPRLLDDKSNASRRSMEITMKIVVGKIKRVKVSEVGKARV